MHIYMDNILKKMKISKYTSITDHTNTGEGKMQALPHKGLGGGLLGLPTLRPSRG